MIGLVPDELEDLFSDGLFFPLSAVGGVDFRPGVLFPDFFSSALSELDLDEGLASSGFLVTTFASYGLNARCLISGVERGFSGFPELPGDERLIASLLTLITFFLSIGGSRGLVGVVSAPI